MAHVHAMTAKNTTSLVEEINIRVKVYQKIQDKAVFLFLFKFIYITDSFLFLSEK